MARKRRQDSDLTFDFTDFDFKIVPEQYNAEDEEVLISKLECFPAMYENALEMADSMDYSKDYFAFLAGSFIFGDFLEALCEKKLLYPDEIYIATLGMNKGNIDNLYNLLGRCKAKKLKLVVSNYFYNVEKYRLVKYMQERFKGKAAEVSVLQSHTKIALIFSKKGNCMITGSANLSSSGCVEQFIMMHDENAIAWTKKKLDYICDRFKVYDGLTDISTPNNKKGNSKKEIFQNLTEV